jgi:beta-acetyl hexosaminidase like
MLCGPQTLWPEPSIKSLIGTNANSFQLNDVRYKVQSPFKNVENLMESAFSVFVEELKQIVHSSGGKTSDFLPRTSTRSFKDSSYSSVTSSTHRKNLVNVNIYVNVIKTADVHVTLNTDECYNVTMSSKKKTSRSNAF